MNPEEVTSTLYENERRVLLTLEEEAYLLVGVALGRGRQVGLDGV